MTAASPPRRRRPQQVPSQESAVANGITPWRWQDPVTGEVFDSEQLIEANLNLARAKAWQFCRSGGISYDDAEAVAFVGLVKGCRRFDPRLINPANGNRYCLSTIVVPFVLGELRHHVRDHGFVVRYPARWREVLPRARRLLADGLPLAAVCSACGLDPSELEEMLTALTGCLELPDNLEADEQQLNLDPDLLEPLEQLLADAWRILHPGDAEQIERWWTAGAASRQPVPQRQLDALDNAVCVALRGIRAEVLLQGALIPGMTMAQRRVRRPRQPRDQAVDDLTTDHAVQLLLLGTDPLG